MLPHNLKSSDGSDSNGEPDGAEIVSTAASGDQSHRHSPHQAPRPSGMGWKLTLGAVAVAVALGVGFVLVQHRKAEETEALDQATAAENAAIPEVDVVNVAYAPQDESVQYPGDQTTGWYQSTIYARVSGYIDHWFVDIGDHVKKGQTLATIDTPDLDAELEAAKNQLAVSESEVKVAQANEEFAYTTNQRWENSPEGVVSEQEREDKKAAYASSVAEVAAAQAKVDSDQANVNRLKAFEQYKKVTAPYDGVITGRHIDIGDLVIADSTASTTPLYDMAEIDKIRVFVDVPQGAAAGLAVGVPAVVTANNLPGEALDGAIARTSDAIDPATRDLRVEVDVNNHDGLLLPGTYTNVTFQVSHKGLLSVPASAMLFPAEGPEVAVVTRDGRVNFHPVNIADDDGAYVELSSGVKADEQVALNLSNQVTEGEKVQATNISDQFNVTQAPAPSSPNQNTVVANSARLSPAP